MNTKHFLRTAVAAAALFLLPSSASAFGSIGVDVGAMETESFSSGFSTGVRAELGGDNLAVFLRLGHADGFDEFDPKDRGTYGKAWERHRHADEFSVIPLECGLLLRTPDLAGFRLYGAGGVGYYFVDFADNKWFGDTRDDVGTFGWWALGGVEYGFDMLAFYLEAKYTAASEKEDVYLYDWVSHTERRGRVDVDLSGVSILFGVRLAF